VTARAPAAASTYRAAYQGTARPLRTSGREPYTACRSIASNGWRRRHCHHSSAPFLPPVVQEVRANSQAACSPDTADQSSSGLLSAGHLQLTSRIPTWCATPPRSLCHITATCCLSWCSPQRLVRHLWRAYCYALATSPLATQSATAVVGFAAGDACAQVWHPAASHQTCLFTEVLCQLTPAYRCIRLLLSPGCCEWCCMCVMPPTFHCTGTILGNQKLGNRQLTRSVCHPTAVPVPSPAAAQRAARVPHARRPHRARGAPRVPHLPRAAALQLRLAAHGAAGGLRRRDRGPHGPRLVPGPGLQHHARHPAQVAARCSLAARAMNELGA
jgi:hypothetical protein